MCLMASGSLLPSIDHLDNKQVDKNVLYYSYERYKEFYNLYSATGAKLFVQLSIQVSLSHEWTEVEGNIPDHHMRSVIKYIT